MTRTTNSHHVTIQMMGKGQGWAMKGTTGAAGARDTTCLKPSICFFFLLTFYLLNVYFALRTTLMMTNGYRHHHTPSQSA